MGRRKKYHTEEEYKEAKRMYHRTARLKEVEKENRETVPNPIKRVKMKMADGAVNLEIGTMDRTKLNTAFMEFHVSAVYTDDNTPLYKMRDNCKQAFRDWLCGQNMWDDKMYISLCDIPEMNRSYVGIVKTITFEFHLRRKVITDFNDMIENLTGLATYLVDNMKKTCQETGLELKRKLSNNPNYR